MPQGVDARALFDARPPSGLVINLRGRATGHVLVGFRAGTAILILNAHSEYKGRIECQKVVNLPRFPSKFAPNALICTLSDSNLLVRKAKLWYMKALKSRNFLKIRIAGAGKEPGS